MRGGLAGCEVGMFGLTLSAATCWAVHGCLCRPRDLSELESEWVAEVLDCLEAGFAMSIAEYERQFSTAFPTNIAAELRMIAWNLECELAVTT